MRQQVADIEETAAFYSWSRHIDEFLEAKRDQQLADNTIRFYRCQLSNLARRMAARGIRLEAFTAKNLIADMRERQEQGVSQNSLRHDAVAARAFTKWARKNRILARDPLADYTTPRGERPTKRVPSADELRHLFEVIEDRHRVATNPSARYVPQPARLFRQRRTLAVIAVALDTCARISEVLALRIQDIDLEARVIQFAKTKNQKPHRHTVPISPELCERIELWLRSRPKNLNSNFLFVDEISGEDVTPRTFSRIFNRYVKLAGLDGVTFHSLRHYAITGLALENRLVAQRMAGHQSPNTTDLYVHESVEQMRAAHARTGTLAGILSNKRSQAEGVRQRRGRIV